MKNKTNIAELLKDCPTGMELDCTMYDSVTLLNVNNREDITFPIKVLREDGNYIALTKYGQYTYADFAKCVIFPKGKTTWENFVPPYKFEDGDVVATNSGCFIGIIEIKNNMQVGTYCATDYRDDFKVNPDYVFSRLATEKEKQKLFDAIKDNGYHWDAETKILKKLPMFKVGDKIRHKTNNEDIIYEISEVYNDFYGLVDYTFMLDMKYQDSYELVPNKFDATTLVPFESRVLVRDTIKEIWKPDFFGCLYGGNNCPYSYMVVGGIRWKCCIPYEGNEHLLGKTEDCDEYYKIWE